MIINERSLLPTLVLAVLCSSAAARPLPTRPPPRSAPSSESSARALLSPRFRDALTFAARLHNHQVRKNTETPYLSHLLQVAGLVLEHGGTEKEAIAALLHDAVEDQGGPRTQAQIQKRFGAKVARIVSEVTEVPDASWRVRKETKIKRIANGEMSSSALLVKLADNLQNVRSMVEESRGDGPEFWNRFGGGRDGTLWYYRSLVRAYSKAGVESPLADSLSRAVRQLARTPKPAAPR